MNPRTGRPPLPEGQAKTAVLRVRFTETEYAKIKAAGGAEWARTVLLKAARRTTGP